MRKQSLSILLAGLAFTNACNPSTKPQKQVDKPTINSHKIQKKDIFDLEPDNKLFLNAYFSECGEWGGHHEKMVIFARENDHLYLEYQRFDINCDSAISNNNPNTAQKLITAKTIKLDETSKKSIRKYIERLEKSKKDEEFPGHAGNTFNVSKSDSTFSIEVYDSKKYDLDSYSQLLRELKLTNN